MTAARLAKADQASRLVGEFAELEGYVGAVYARRAGLPEPVAAAIAEQYLPAAAGAEPPASVPGALVALADKLDSLATAFGLGEQPTGSRDPYGLRRAAAGVVSIVLDRGFALDLSSLVMLDLAQHAEQGSDMTRDAAEWSSPRSCRSCSTGSMPCSRRRAFRRRRSAQHAGPGAWTRSRTQSSRGRCTRRGPSSLRRARPWSDAGGSRAGRRMRRRRG